MLLWMLAVRLGSLLRIVRMSSVDSVPLSTLVVTFWQPLHSCSNFASCFQHLCLELTTSVRARSRQVYRMSCKFLHL